MPGCQTGCCCASPSPSGRWSLVGRSADAVAVAVGDDDDGGGCGDVAGDSAAVVESVVGV